MSPHAIAIIGMACRFPGGENLHAFWELLISQAHAIEPIPPERFSLSEPHFAGLLPDIAGFDLDYFSTSQTEAASMDLQQRLLLEVSADALQDAGLPQDTLKGKRVGVFVGVSSVDYTQTQLQSLDQVNMYTITGAATSVIANRLSYFYDWHGPSMVVDTACSSSLTALHLACQSLRAGDSEMALVGGVNILLSPLLHQGFAEAQALSPDGLCKSFDASANGIVRGEGAGVVVLKSLEAAKADNDRIYAVILGSGISQDGQTNGLSAPSPAGQRRTFLLACNDAGLDPANVAFVEAHGTGTPLGDPIEARSMADIYGKARKERGLPALKIGSVKTQIGHLEAAAGIAGLIKTALAQYHQTIPLSLHFKTPNPLINFAKWHLEVLTETQSFSQLPEDSASTPAHFGVSAFGFGGTNVHVLLGPAPSQVRSSDAEISNSGYAVLPLSAHNPEALSQRIADLSAWLNQNKIKRRNFLYTSRLRQSHGSYRTSLVFKDFSELGSELRRLSQAEPIGCQTRKMAERKLVFLFSGMGSQEKGMGQQLLAEPIFYQKLKEIDSALFPWSGFSVIEAIETGYDDAPEIVQPVLFALQLALVAQWAAWGIYPDALMGTSMGEVTAACAGGWLSLDDACCILVRRIALLKTAIGTGAMGIIGLSAAEVEKHLHEKDLWIAGLNGPELTAVSGSESALNAFLETCKIQGIFARRIKGADAPSHSPLMKDLQTPLAEAIAKIVPQIGHTPVFSSVNPAEVPHTDFSADYWWQNLSQPVRLLPAFEALSQTSYSVFIEISPHPVIIGGLLPAADLINAQLSPEKAITLLPSLRRDLPDLRPMFESLGSLFNLGFDLNWRELQNRESHSVLKDETVVSLPIYPWQRQNTWLEPPEEFVSHKIASPLAARISSGKHLRVTTGAAERLNSYDQLFELAPEQRLSHLVSQLQQELALALRLPPEQIDPEEPLKHLGIGSLVGMELFSRLKKKFAVKLPLSEFLQGPSLNEMAKMILKGLALESTITPKRPEQLPLSYAQTRFWLLEQLLPGERTHFIPVAVEISGPLQTALLQSACQSVIQRHEILRTVYRQNESGEPFQLILASPPSPWSLIQIPDHFTETDLSDSLRDHARLAFDWQNAPPLRITLFVWSDSQSQSKKPILLFSLHHILADGLSFRVLFQEIKAFYEAALHKTEAYLPPLSWQYADFALWQRSELSGLDQQNDLNYWKNQLSLAPSQTLPPLENTRPGRPQNGDRGAFLGAQFPFEVAPETYEALESFSKQQGLSLFSLLLSAYYLLLWKLTESKDLVIGTPVAGRLESETHDLIGPFLNMLPLRQKIDPDQTWAIWLKQVQEQLLQALAHQSTPFEQIVEAIQPPRINGLHPLFQSVLALHGEIGFEPLGECEISPIEIDIGVARFDLAFTLIPEQGKLKGSVEYNRALFSHESVELWIEVWLEILKQLPQIEFSLAMRDWAIPFSERFEKHSKYEHSPSRVLEMLKPSSESVAIIDLQSKDANSIWTYAELWQKAQEIAQNILLSSVSGDWVAVCLPRSPEMVAAWLGAWLANRAYVPLDPDSPADRLIDLIGILEFPLVICSPETEKRLNALQKVDCLNPFLASSEPIQLPEPSQNLSHLIFTSGSSGKPKAVQITQAGMAQLIHWHLQTYPIQIAEKIPQTANIAFDAAGWEIWSTLAGGGSLLFLERSTLLDPQKLQQAIHEYGIHQLFLPTPLAAQILQLHWSATTPLQVLRTGGDKLPPFEPQSLPFAVWNHYGPSECTVVATAGLISENSSANSPDIGQLLPGFAAQILDPFGHPLPKGFFGQLALSGVGLSPGYWPQNPPNTFVFNPDLAAWSYLTGDRVRFWQDRFHFLGRIDRQFKLNGIRIEPGEIENTLLRHDQVLTAAVLLSNNQIWAFYTGALTPDEIRIWLSAHLPQALLPAHFQKIDLMPETERGKIAYDSLLSLTQTEIHTLSSAAGSQIFTQLEKDIALLWQKLLLTPIQLNSDFFASGGHSLLALQMVQTLRQQLGREITLQMLFSNPELSAFAKAVAAAPLIAVDLPQIQPEPSLLYQPYPLTDVQSAYWVGRQAQMVLGGVGAQAYLEFELPELQPAILEQALNALIVRHPLLRTIFTPEGLQETLAELPQFELSVLDFSQVTDPDQSSQLLTIRASMQQKIFAPDSWPLFDIKVCKTFNSWRLLVHIDALIADATSFLLLGKELEQLYLRPELVLPPLSLSFRDYLSGLAILRSGPLYQRDQAYWLARLAQLPDPPHLPLKQAPEKLNQIHFDRLSLQLDAESWQKLKSKGASFKLTPNGLILSLFAGVLACWSENDQFLINLTTFQRLPMHPEVEQLVGDFTCLTLLAIPSFQGTLAEWAVQVQEQLWQDLEHTLYSGVEVLRELRQLGHSGGAPVVFTGLLGQALPALPLAAKLTYAQTQTPQVWLDCQASEDSAGLNINWDYLLNLFPEGLIENLFATFQALLIRLANHPAQWHDLLKLSLICGELPEAVVRAEANATFQTIQPQFLHSGFLAQAKIQPQALALKSAERNLSYAQLLAEAAAYADQLQAHGLKSAEPVAILMHKGWEQAVAVLAVLFAGGAYLPIDASLPSARILTLLEMSQAKHVLYQPALKQELKEVFAVANGRYSLSEVIAPSDPLAVPLDHDCEKFLAWKNTEQLAYLIFTSGSTGLPKGVMISHASAWNTVIAVNQMLQLQPSDRVWGLSSLSFDLSVYDLFGTWAAGACLVLPPPGSQREPDKWLPELLQSEITIWNSVPALMGLLITYLERQPELKLNALRAVMLSGDWIPLPLPEQILTHAPHARIWSLGGATEASIWSNFYPIALPLSPDWNSIPYGKPLANQSFEVFNRDFEACPDWVNGELCISGSGLALGYWKDPEKTEKQFFIHPRTGQRWYRTGDRGRYRPGGILEFLGRNDHQVKIQGYRIELGEIESALRSHPQIIDALVLAVGERNQRRLCAYFVARQNLSPEVLKEFLTQILPVWMVPQQWMELDAFPLNSSGKPDRSRLPEILAFAEPKSNAPPPPECDNLAKIFHDELQLEITDIDIDLLGLGVNSIDLIRLGNKLQSVYGHAPGVGEMFQLRTLRELAAYYSRPDKQTSLQAPTQLGAFLIKKLPDREYFGKKIAFSPLEMAPEMQAWQSTRHFLATPLKLEQLMQFLSPLLEFNRDKRMYPSAGGVYPIQLYLQIAPDRCLGLDAGFYYFSAQTNQLTHLSSEIIEMKELHLPESLIMAKDAAFGLYFVADLSAMQARYGADARDYCLIETGAILQLLRQWAPLAGLGICSIGQIQSELLRKACKWESGDACLHSLLGGIPDLAPQTQSQVSISSETEQDWEEWIF
jgi:amino acid adenylation domain-containing protein